MKNKAISRAFQARPNREVISIEKMRQSAGESLKTSIQDKD